MINGAFLTSSAMTALKAGSRIAQTKDKSANLSFGAGLQAAKTKVSNEELVRIIQQGGDKAKEAMEKLISQNKGLIIYFAKKLGLAPKRITDDLLQEGNIGLMKAAEDFSPESGCKFASYAFYHILNALFKYFGECGLVRIPSWIKNKLRNIEKVFQQSVNVEVPNVEEILSKKHKADTVKGMLRTKELKVTSLDNLSPEDVLRRPHNVPAGEYGENLTLSDVIKDETDEARTEFDNVLTEIDKKGFSEKLERMLSSILSPREVNILKMRYGKRDGVEHTFKEIGSRYNITMQRVSQILEGALEKVRQYMLLLDTVKSTTGKDALEEILQNIDKKEVRLLLKSITNGNSFGYQERRVFKLKHGMNRHCRIVDTERSFEEIGSKFGIRPTKVKEVYDTALERIERNLEHRLSVRKYFESFFNLGIEHSRQSLK